MKIFPAIVAIALAMFAGCAHEQYYSDGKTPEITITEDRHIFYHNRMVTLGDLPHELEKSAYPKDRTLPIRMKNLHDLRAANDVLVYLRIKGWTRAVLVTEKHATSEVVASQKRMPPPPPKPAPRRRRR